MGIVVDEEVAKRTPCTCYKIGPTNEPKDLLCFSPGVIGTLTDAQDVAYCTERHIKPAKDGIPTRVEKFREASDVCVREVEALGLPKGERLKARLECMGRELKKRGIEV